MARDTDHIDYKECTCDEHEHDYHPCPFAVEVDGDETECNCCPSCTEECAQNI